MKYASETISEMFDQSKKIIDESKKLSENISEVIEVIVSAIQKGNKIILFGNGGSAADAQHMAAEFIGRYLNERKSIPAIALTSDSSIITAIGNDYGFEKVFSRQCESLVKKDDVIIAISTSGKSINVINGIKIAKERGGIIVSFTGIDGGELKNISDYLINIPSNHTPRIQEGHRAIIHIICELVEKSIMK